MTNDDKLKAYVDRAKVEILEDARTDPRYFVASNFAALHELCDANDYGADVLVEDTAVVERGQAILDAWIRSGEMRAEARQMIADAEGHEALRESVLAEIRKPMTARQKLLAEINAMSFEAEEELFSHVQERRMERAAALQAKFDRAIGLLHEVSADWDELLIKAYHLPDSFDEFVDNLGAGVEFRTAPDDESHIMLPAKAVK